MKTIEEIKANGRFLLSEYVDGDGGYGYIYFPTEKKPCSVIFSCGGGWEHVSVSMKKRNPTWDEMCLLKDIFFKDTEWVVQYHPAKEDYINFDQHCLHLWRCLTKNFPIPPKILV